MSKIGARTVCACLLAVCFAYAQKQLGEPREMSSSYNPRLWHGDDARFVVDTVEMSRSEVELSKLAILKSSNTAVQNLALVLIRDAGKIDRTLSSWSRSYGFALPKEKEREKVQAAEDRLNELNGADFDQAYLNLMTKDHAADLKRFRTEAADTTDSDLERFTKKYEPKLQADGQYLLTKTGT